MQKVCDVLEQLLAEGASKNMPLGEPRPQAFMGNLWQVVIMMCFATWMCQMFIRNLVSMGQRAWVIGKLAENNNKGQFE